MYEKELGEYERWMEERIETMRGIEIIRRKMCGFFGVKA